MLEIILHVIVAQIGGKRHGRQGSMARDTEEMFNHGPAHSGASLFSLSSLWFISLFVLSRSLSLPTAAGLPLGGNCIMAGLIYWLISSHQIQLSPDGQLKTTTGSAHRPWQQVTVGPRAGGCDRRCWSLLGRNKSCRLSLLFDSVHQKDKRKPLYRAEQSRREAWTATCSVYILIKPSDQKLLGTAKISFWTSFVPAISFPFLIIMFNWYKFKYLQLHQWDKCCKKINWESSVIIMQVVAKRLLKDYTN